MSLLVIHFQRNPRSWTAKIDEFELEVGCQQRWVGCYARVLVHEWQVDLLDKLPLHLLSASHVVVADDWRGPLLRKLGSPDNRI
eukprot:27395-Karenia_brevis.AAC.1